MYGPEVFIWSENEVDQMEVGQNRMARIVWNAPRYGAVNFLGETLVGALLGQDIGRLP